MSDVYDLVVVGAGPAGSSAAKAAADGGARVLLVEKRRTVGLPVQCAEHIPMLLMREVHVDARTIVQETGGMKTFLPDGDVVETRAPGVMLDRFLFDKGLALDAVASGVDLTTGTIALSRDGDRVIVRQEGQQLEIRCSIIIGADGPRSTVGGWVGQVNQDLVVALQCEVPIREACWATEVYFDLTYAGGYGWLFPKGKTANVGVGVNPRLGGNLREALRHLLDRLVRSGRIRERTAVGYAAGVIPVGGPVGATWVGNVVLVGDAAGQTHPITGSGIPTAVICGKMAGEVAAEAVREGDPRRLEAYEVRWRERFGEGLERATRKRRMLDDHWDEGHFGALLRSSWVAFREYYRDG